MGRFSFWMTLATVKVLPGAGRAEQDLVAEAAREAVLEALDRLRLVAGGLERGDQLEVGHGPSLADGPTRNRTGVLWPAGGRATADRTREYERMGRPGHRGARRGR